MERGRGRGRRRLSGSVARLSHGESPLARETAGTGDTRTATSAHPRWRGEDMPFTQVVMWAEGSSPLARGGLPGREWREDGRRLIPAGAGRTATPMPVPWASSAHPRWRGEDGLVGDVVSPAMGSSPLARGGRRGRRGRVRRVRLIPAGAGRTRVCAGVPGLGGAHPRWRGEDDKLANPLATPVGSSPLARGGHTETEFDEEGDGLIPAGAGRTFVCDPALILLWAHPRWRGEDVQPDGTVARVPGSSPLARGGLALVIVLTGGVRLIPAGAGRTRISSGAIHSFRAHPRWRGDEP